jgi:hypothetical protein
MYIIHLHLCTFSFPRIYPKIKNKPGTEYNKVYWKGIENAIAVPVMVYAHLIGAKLHDNAEYCPKENVKRDVRSLQIDVVHHIKK